MLKLEGNQPKEHNNSNNKAIFPFLLNFLIYGYITGTQVMLNAVMLKVVVVFLFIYLFIIIIFNPESWRLFSSSYTKKKQPNPKKTLKKGQVCTKDNHRTKKNTYETSLLTPPPHSLAICLLLRPPSSVEF